uniref:5'-deoxyadenosine deaminase n=1 Tax=Candidatus Methanogaster sp. ANME-2c ERB4 TaxID=2759911 RepID=A0A7G9Y0Q7_9EURY|nr:5'-deoxyadenosine deaminase [Methanosarcinales archaeon ANME-2c ERB4]QNO41375.1 5'-deoxyadenosine deaminase [Methanosarcinales archaeon ANME-2c ERB4]QNO41591.1 5'-deoxyadenosine deaminase [Methanosarcinales archaeon ANME-2c ERB4]
MPIDEYLLSGSILCGEDFDVVEGYICIRDGVIAEICEESGRVDALAHGIVLPAFVNAHTHIGDSVLKDPEITDIASLVRPPDGLKHRVLRKTSMHDLVHAMRASICDMVATGTCAFADFREGGLPGVLALMRAIDAASASGCAVDAVILGRPGGGKGDDIDEIDSILELAGGIGISSTNDYERGVAAAIAGRTRGQGGIFAIHAGELNSTDIKGALELNPDLLIHLTHASRDDLRGVAEENIPVVVCIRSNLVTRVGIPPVKEMLAAGLLVAAGTDNVMFNSVDLFSEMRFLSSLCQIDEGQVLRICTRAGALALGLNCGVIAPGMDARVTVLDKDSYNLTGAKNSLRSVVRRARAGDIVFCSGGAGTGTGARMQ